MPKRRRIPAMTGEQTRRVQDAVLKLASDWLSARGAKRVRMAASAYLDMDRDCYVGIVTFDDVTPESATVKEGTLQWDLDDAFKPIGDATVELKD